MGLDLELFAISKKADYIIEKARQNRNYAIDMYMICRTDDLKQSLKMEQSNDKGSEFVNSLTELINDSEFVTSFYPHNQKDQYRFYSGTRGYDTLNYLLRQYITDRPNLSKADNQYIFYGGTDIDFAEQFVQFQYLNTSQVIAICDLLNLIEFDNLLKYYNYEKMEGNVYKLTRPENLGYLRAEFDDLKNFYKNAQQLDAFVITRVS
jgi:hypothetical protein